jgi:hypothetical protein
VVGISKEPLDAEIFPFCQTVESHNCWGRSNYDSNHWGVWTLQVYLAQRAVEADTQNRTRLLEIQKPFFEKQLAILFEMSNLVGKLQTSAGRIKTQKKKDWEGNEWKENEKRWDILYNGEFAVIANCGLSTPVGNFSQALQEFRKVQNDETLSELQTSGFAVTAVIKEFIRKSWANGSTLDAIAAWDCGG